MPKFMRQRHRRSAAYPCRHLGYIGLTRYSGPVSRGFRGCIVTPHLFISDNFKDESLPATNRLNPTGFQASDDIDTLALVDAKRLAHSRRQRSKLIVRIAFFCAKIVAHRRPQRITRQGPFRGNPPRPRPTGPAPPALRPSAFRNVSRRARRRPIRPPQRGEDRGAPGKSDYNDSMTVPSTDCVGAQPL